MTILSFTGCYQDSAKHSEHSILTPGDFFYLVSDEPIYKIDEEPVEPTDIYKSIRYYFTQNVDQTHYIMCDTYIHEELYRYMVRRFGIERVSIRNSPTVKVEVFVNGESVFCESVEIDFFSNIYRRGRPMYGGLRIGLVMLDHSNSYHLDRILSIVDADSKSEELMVRLEFRFDPPPTSVTL